MRTVIEGIYAFEAEGVLVQPRPEIIHVFPRQRELQLDPAMWRQVNFRPSRLIVNLEFVDRNSPEEPLQYFEGPIQLQVYYTLHEKIEALRNKREYPPVAYWLNGKWNLIPEEKIEDVYPVLSRTWAGFLRFEITEWGDPTIGLGS